MNYNGKLIIYTSFYKFQAYSSYCASLVTTVMLLDRLGINFDYWPGPSDAHIERAVNQALTRFAQDEEATDFLNIDSDEGWDPAGIIRLLLRPEEIISGVYPMTNEWGRYTGQLKTADDGVPLGKLVSKNEALLEAERVPGGFLRIKKGPIQHFINAYSEDYFYFQEEKVWRFFWNEIENHVFTGMDYALSEKFKALGYQLWIDPMLKIDHYGIKRFVGDFDGYLRNQKKATEAFSEVKRMAETINNG